MGAAPRLVGREAEQGLLAEAVKATASGRPCAVIVHGEAGAGKTRLVREVCDALGVEVLWGTCVHFGEASVPFAPVAGALQSWLAHADAQERAEVLAGAGELGTVLPALGGARSSEPGQLLPLIDLVVNRIADRRPVVLVIDDLQWADRTSLDVLAYLITGFREQRLALLATCRDEHRVEGHPLHGWLADMRRMPLFSEVQLGRLDLAATETQIQSLLGRAVDLDFAAQVHQRSAGNPYLTELLVGGLSGDEQELPATAPAALRDALLASWHGLSPAARQVTRVLATGGRPVELGLMTGVAAEHGVEPAVVSGCLTEAQDHGVVRRDGAGRPWFRHPLLAEVLYDAVPPDERARMHASYITVLESAAAGAPGRAADLAVHHHRAGSPGEAFRWSIAAADEAADLRAAAEQAVHLERACSLWDEVPPDVRGPDAGHLDLLRRASEVCGRVGRSGAAIDLAAQALDLVDPDRQPLLTSTLLLTRRKLSLPRPALAKAVDPELLEAVRLTESFPDSPERAQAVAALAVAEHWDSWGGVEAETHAEEAVGVARRSGSPLALAVALSARALVHVFTDGNSLADAEEAERLARSCGSIEWLEDAGTWRVHSLFGLGRTAEATAVGLELSREVVAGGSGYLIASLAAGGLLDLGRWDECRAVLRTALAARTSGRAGASIRLTAAQLAVRQGRLPEAGLHVDRAEEVLSGDFTGLRGLVTMVRAELFVASGEPLRALHWFERELAVTGAAGVDEDRLPMFANVAAEAAQAARDVGDADGVSRAVDALDQMLGGWLSAPFSEERLDAVDQAMSKAVFEAEVARCRGEPGQAELWRAAIDKCRVAGFPCEEAVARLRCAEAVVAAGPPYSSAVGELLRDARRWAVEVGAEPLRDKIESLARRARVSLRQPPAPPGLADEPAVLAGLTAREREILGFLVAGRSNGEIAKDLVLSTKTVSVHVSNILRKTGTSSRVEVAALAERLSGHRDA